MVKGLTKQDATGFARTMRYAKDTKFVVWFYKGKVRLNRLDDVSDYNDFRTFLTASWDDFKGINPAMTQAQLAEMIYLKVNKEMQEILKNQADKQPNVKDEYISKKELAELMVEYIEKVGTERSADDRIISIRYNRKRGTFYLGDYVHRVRDTYLDSISVYEFDDYYYKFENILPLKNRAIEMTKHAYKIVNKDVNLYWRDLYENYQEELGLV